MPKKTREEKIKSSLRKKDKLLKQHLSSKEYPVSNYFKTDLAKSLSLVSIIIALEIILYFGTINDYPALIWKIFK